MLTGDAIHDIVYHWVPPLFGGALTAWVGWRVKQNEHKRQTDESDARAFRTDIKSRIDSIRKQNHWHIRKMTELVTAHNMIHKESHVDMDDYPNGFGTDRSE